MNKKEIISIIFVFVVMLFLAPSVLSYNYEHRNVTARVNITSAPPEILQIAIDQDIVLNAGSTKTISAIATIRDWNGFNDINMVNATFYYHENESDPDHREVHYTNTSCVEINTYDTHYADYNCSFDVYFYANSGSWIVNVSTNDTHGFSDSLTNTTNINALYALNVTDVIDYGELIVTETSSNKTANVTNLGNVELNISVLGYGLVEGDGIGLVCDQGTNISVENQRFSGSEVIWDGKIPLSTTNQDMSITLVKPTQDQEIVTQNTYWQLYVPPNPFGVCEGIVRFTATMP